MREAKRMFGVMIRIKSVALQHCEHEVGKILPLKELVCKRLNVHVAHEAGHVLVATLAYVVVEAVTKVLCTCLTPPPPLNAQCLINSAGME